MVKKIVISAVVLSIAFVYALSPNVRAYIYHSDTDVFEPMPVDSFRYGISESLTVDTSQVNIQPRILSQATFNKTPLPPKEAIVEVNFGLPGTFRLSNAKVDYSYTGVELAKSAVGDKKFDPLDDIADNFAKNGLGVEIKVSL